MRRSKKSTRVQEYKSILAPLIGIILGAIIAFLLSSIAVHAQESCPQDWHPPPCGLPPKVEPRKKAAAEAAANWHANASAFFSVWEEAACDAVMLGYKPARLVCAGAKASRIAADKAEKAERKVANDPYDPNFESAYEGRWLSYDELGLWEFLELSDGSPYVYNIAEHIQAVEMLGDFIGVSLDRAESCYRDDQGISHLCYIWQFERVETGVIYLGQRLEAQALNFWYLAQVLTPDIGQGVNPDFVSALQEMAGWTYWAGREYQQ